MEEATFSLALDAIYDAATEFERWPLALERLGQAFGCSYVGLIDRNPRTMEARVSAVGIDLAGQQEFFEVWSKHDILRRRTPVYRPGAVETDQDILPKADLLRSDYYNGFMKPHEMHGYMRMTLAVENEFRRIISLSRPISLGDYEAADVEQCRRLTPHLQRAARVNQQVEESKLKLAAFSDVLEQSPTGVLLLSGTGRILFANCAARAMAQAADGLVLRGQRIEVLHSQGNVLSGGERRRVEIARALATEPKFILLDEPFTGIDPVTIEEIQEILFRLKKRGIGILITDHNVAATLRITDRNYILIDGKIIAQGTSKEIAAIPPRKTVRIPVMLEAVVRKSCCVKTVKSSSPTAVRCRWRRS